MTTVLSNSSEAKEEELDPKAESFTQMMANAASNPYTSKTLTEDKTRANTNSESATTATNTKLAIATSTDTRSTTTATTDCGSAQKSSSRTAVARFKLMKPSRFPIRKLSHMSFPPGLNPATLLDSPILQSSNEAEPSPTTGTSPLYPIGSPGASTTTGGAVLGLASVSVTASEKSSNVQEGGSPTIVYKPVPSFSRQAISAIPISESPAPPSGTIKGFPQAAILSPKTPVTNKCKALVPIGATGNVNEVSALRTDQLQLSLQSITHIEMPSEDGYNWRKYGQKSVKNTGFTRSYYRCAQANCPAKKIVEQTHVVIKGEHDHPKPQAIRRMPAGASPAINKSLRDSMGGISKGDLENVTDVLPVKGQLPNCESGTTQTSEPSSSSTDGDEGVETVRSKHDEVEGVVRVRDDEGCDDEHDFKNRKKQKSGDGAAKLSLRSIREPRVVVQTTCEGDTVDDGYRWCKYGQKLIKGKSHPRSYYKCHSPGCPVRKHVERSSIDAKTVISTYEGTHNHEMPASRTNGHTIAAQVLSSTNLPPIPDTASAMSNVKSAILQSPFSKGRTFQDIVNGHPNLSLQQPGVMGGRQLEERGEDRPVTSDIPMPRALAVALPGSERAITTPVNFLKSGIDGRSAFQRAESLTLRPKVEPDDGKCESALPNKVTTVSALSDSKPDKIV